MYEDKLTKLEEKIKEMAPTFELKFKNQSKFMEVLSKILFFNKNFMTSVKTTIGTTVYWTTEEDYKKNPRVSFMTLAHEFVHIMDYKKNPVSFVLSYLFPQILAIFSLLAIFALLNPWFLLFLIFLIFLAPLPAPWRKKWEMRGYGMSVKVLNWWFNLNSPMGTDWYVEQFTGPSYYFMWPFQNSVKKEFAKWADPKDNSCLEEPVYKVVYDIIKE